MAGMLPGVESARRRRIRGSGGWSDQSSVVGSGLGSARIRVFHDTHITPISLLQRSIVNRSDEDDKLGGAAREAKERLDGRLRGHLKQDIKRQSGQETLSSVGRRLSSTTTVMEDMKMEILRSKKNGLKRLRWGKKWLRWKSSEEDECAICLDQFKASEKIAQLPCVHRFHSDCLLPWLEGNAHCPCCRANVFSSS
ncbi:putative transcription factor C2H2 family [Helianthus annuus]|nr:putative transcription factor C2H2 family [Helianthus annuus]